MGRRAKGARDAYPRSTAAIEGRVHEPGAGEVVPTDPNAVGPPGTPLSIEAFRGPLPHPDHFQACDQTLPGAADRILKLAERQSAHRLRHEEIDQRAGIGARALGQWFAFLLVAGSLALGGYLAAAGVTLIGIIVLLCGLLGFVVPTFLKLQRLLALRGSTEQPQDDAPALPAPASSGKPGRRSR